MDRINDFVARLAQAPDFKKEASAVLPLLRSHWEAACRACIAQAKQATGQRRAALVFILGRLLPRNPSFPEGWTWLLQESQSSDAQVVRRVLGALSKWDDPQLDERLVVLWHKWPALRTAVAEAMGKCGGTRALEILTDSEAKSEKLLSENRTFLNIVRRSLLQLRARLGRTPKKWYVLENVTLPQKTFVRLHTRCGLEPLLLRELDAWGLQDFAQSVPGVVELPWEGPLSRLFQARLFAYLGFSLKNKLPADKDFSQSVEQVICKKVVRQLRALEEVAGWVGSPPFRYRLVRVGQGHQRAWIRELASQVGGELPLWRNDPVQSDWEVYVDEEGGVEIIPQGVDPRFAYREREVPASSHPPLAAALAFVMKPQHGERVWDPFAGAGTELIEVGLRWREKQLHLVGSDISKDAVQAASHNAQRAAVPIDWFVQDALHVPAHSVDWIVTNPPLGRRVARGKARHLLQQFLSHAAHLLPSRGHLVWVSPFPEEHHQQAKLLGMQTKEAHRIDMNGFFAELQVLQKK